MFGCGVSMKTQFQLAVYNDSTRLDFTNMYTLEVFGTFNEAINAARLYSRPWQIKEVSEYVVEDGEIAQPFPKRETYFTIEPDCENWCDYDTMHDTLQSAINEAKRYIENEHCKCIVKQIREVTVAYSEEV